MSRRRKNTQPRQNANQLDRPQLNVTISMRPDGAIEVDPKYNKAVIEHLDLLYSMANREDYEREWTDDHKLAFFLVDMLEGFLAQWSTPIASEEVDGSVANVPHITESPVRDVFDINDMEAVNGKPN